MGFVCFRYMECSITNLDIFSIRFGLEIVTLSCVMKKFGSQNQHSRSFMHETHVVTGPSSIH